ncbi:MAG: C39 family peptidase [Candidatus Entotheonellia bacterium]
MSGRLWVIAGVGMLLGLAVGCAQIQPPYGQAPPVSSPSQTFVIAGVPFFPQEDYYCGPASLASVLQFYGVLVDQHEIASEVYLSQLKGTLTLDMLTYPSRVGLKARSYRGNLDDLKTHLLSGEPLVLFLNLGSRLLPQYHYLVAIGFDDAEAAVVTHSGTVAHKRIPYQELLKAWEKTDHWTLFIHPPIGS